MRQHWTSILHTDEEFWSRQWIKHGSCSLNLFKTELEYFKQGLKWNEELPLGQILRSKNVLPSNDKVYKYKQFYDNIRDVIGRTPHLKCHSYKVIILSHLHDSYILYKILFILNFFLFLEYFVHQGSTFMLFEKVEARRLPQNL